MTGYSEGRQPCEDFRPQRDGNAFATWDNVHECFGPYPVVDGVERCSGAVSFCSGCTRDHHLGGWDKCPVPLPVETER